VKIGIGIAKPESDTEPLKKLISLIEKRPGPLKKLGRICPIESHFGVVPNAGPRKVTSTHRVLLVGDSAGQINPFILEGIRFAIKYGRLAEEAADYAINRDNDVEFERYEKNWKKDVWSNFRVALDIQKKWLQFSDKQWDEEIPTLTSLPPVEFLELLRCQLSARKLISLAANHPEILKSQTSSTMIKSKMRRVVF
jgi:digeranylgeranylglycerophospholipid reductase